MNTTIIKQGTEKNPVDWEVKWNGEGWYAGAEGRTVKLDAENLQSAQSEARSKGLGTATFHWTEMSLVNLHGKTRKV